MPRAKKAPGNQHNSRHENGIVAPGKRVTKQKSNGHLNGSAEHSGPATLPAVPSSDPRASVTTSEPRINGAPTKAKDSAQTAASAVNDASEESTNTSVVSSDREACKESAQQQTHRKVDSSTAKHSPLPRDNVLNLAITILRACPLGDTIAILLVLLWLPPTALTVTNALFAVLTFMPHTVALPSFPPTFSDLFVGSGNTPSLATIFLTDIIGLVLWLVIWTPLQTLAIELAQAIVATTLGGGSSAKKQASDNTLFCMSIVTINHVVRNDWLPRQMFGLDWPAILSKIPYVSKESPTFLSDVKPNEYITTRSPASWMRALIALHILIQGLVHVARRWYQRREYTQAVPISKKPDPEAIPGSPARASHVPSADVGGQALTTSSPDGVGRIATSRELREKISVGKRRRRQSTLVRSQQPLWAAFAATKLTFLREFEQSQALKDVANSQATDAKNLGNAQFAREGGRIWIFDVQPNSFCFQTSLATTSDSVLPETDAKDSARPFRVRLNHMEWSSASLERIEDEGGHEQWTVEVFGLSPASSYRCCLIRNEDDLIVYAATITTPSASVTEKEYTAPSTDILHQGSRPVPPKSPATTLQKSILALEAKLSESQARQKRLRKDIKSGTANLRKDLDALNSKINKLSGEDKAHANRHMQWNQLTRQADEATLAISQEIESLGCIPEEDVQKAKEIKAVWDETKSSQASIREDVLHSKEETHRERSSVQNDATTSQQKRERLNARKTKLHDQHERLDSATLQGIDEKHRKTSQEATKELERFQMEQAFAEQLQGLVRATQESRYYTQRIWNQQQAIEAAFHQHQMLENTAPEIERPLTPEGDLPGTNPQSANSTAFRVPAFGSPDVPTNALRSHSGSLRHGGSRPRSTSGLSGSSLYADFDDQDPAPPMPPRAVEVIKERGHMHSRNSGHGSGSSGSQRDPASPGVQGMQVSPVGKRSPVWNS